MWPDKCWYYLLRSTYPQVRGSSRQLYFGIGLIWCHSRLYLRASVRTVSPAEDLNFNKSALPNRKYIYITGFVCLFVFWGKLSAGTTQIIVSGISLKWKQMETFRTLHPTLLVLNHWLSGGETLKSIQSDVTSHRQEHMETGSSEWGEIFSAPEVSSWPVVGEFAGRMLNWRMQWFSYKHTGLECHFSSCVWNSSSFVFSFSSSGEVFPFDSLLNRATDCKYDCYPCIKKNRALNQILEEF